MCSWVCNTRLQGSGQSFSYKVEKQLCVSGVESLITEDGLERECGLTKKNGRKNRRILWPRNPV